MTGPTQHEPMPPEAPKKRSWFARHKIQTGVMAAGVLIAGAGVAVLATSPQGDEAACQKALTALVEQTRSGGGGDPSKPAACEGLDDAALNRIATAVAGKAFADAFKDFGSTSARVATAEPTTDAPSQPAYTPTVKDFTIALKVKSLECFGDAGCNVTYEPKLTIVGPQVDEQGSYEITYEVRGGEDGATIDTIDVEAGQYTASEGIAQTARRSSKLTAVITDVETN